jgi:hypothetical protein
VPALIALQGNLFAAHLVLTAGGRTLLVTTGRRALAAIDTRTLTVTNRAPHPPTFTNRARHAAARERSASASLPIAALGAVLALAAGLALGALRFAARRRASLAS